MMTNTTIREQFAQLSPEQRSKALALLRAQRGTVQTQKSTLPPVDRTRPIPLAFPQEQLWFLQQYQPDSVTYNERIALRLEGSLDVRALETALQAVVQRHESLRTTFAVVEDAIAGASGGATADTASHAMQVIHPFVPGEYGLPPQFLATPGDMTELLQRADAITRQPFTLTECPLWRVALFAVEPDVHVLLLVVHHIIADAWGMAIFLQEMAACYTACCQGQPPHLPALAVTYADFAGWQRQQLQGETLARHLDFWQQSLQGAPLLLPLPTDFPRPPAPSGRGGVQRFTLGADLTQQLKTLSRQAGATLYMTLLSAFHVLLYRYTGQEDMVIGSVQANRAYPELEGVIGHFVNTVALRTRLPGQVPGQSAFRQLLQQVCEQIQASHEHQALPFQRLVQALQPERTMGHHPIYQVSFNLQNQPGFNILSFAGLRVSPLALENQTSKLDLYLLMYENQGELIGEFEYSRDLFAPATIERMTGHFQSLLASIVANPEQPIGDLPMLSATERHQLLVEWNDTASDYPKDKCIHHLFEEQVARTPDAVAVIAEICEDWPADKQPLKRSSAQSLPYRTLNERANQLAHHLQRLGVGPDVLVGLCVERSVEMVVGLLGILKAGGAYVPLDPTYPQERLAFMLQDAAAPVLLTQAHLQTALPPTTAQIVCLDRDWPQIATENSSTPVSQAQADSLAYVIYTSGSTGKPKGVQIMQGALTNFLCAMQQKLALSPQDKLLAVTTLAFDIAGLELYLPLITGAAVLLVPHSVAMDGERLLHTLGQSGATVMQATPATWRLLLAAGWADAHPVDTRHGVRLQLLCGGEALTQPLAAALLTRAADVWNLYGPTETTIWSTVQRLRPHGPITIGQPIANTQAYILNVQQQLAPIGVAGELYLGGAGLARGYLNRPELTQEKFIANPYGEGKLYKTGDLARWLPDGTIEYLGRIDQQVKIRGFRIEPGEIETVLGQHPAVQEAVVIAREDRPGEKRLVAYIVTDKVTRRQGDDTRLEAGTLGERLAEGKEHVNDDVTLSFPHLGALSDLRSHLQQKLPDYMLPSAFVLLDALPLTPNGKVDRKALPAPHRSNLGSAQTYIAPRTATEIQLANIWCAVLGIEQVGIQDNFFERGGHSLLTVQLRQRIQAHFAVSVPLQRLFIEPTIAGLAAQIDAARPAPAALSNSTLADSTASIAHQAPLSCLAPLRTSGERPPFFCVHPLAGVVFPYYELAYRLGVEQPVYGLQAVGLAGKEAPLHNLDTMATHYLSALQTVQPVGPYYLGGWSLGGLIAYVMAQQLQAAGETVACLAIIDTPAPSGQPIGALGDILGFGVKTLAPALGAYIIDYLKLWRQRQSDLSLPAPHRLLRVTLANARAGRQVRLQPYPGHVTLLRSTQDFGSISQRADLGWGDFAGGGVEVVPVPGDHMTLLRQPHVSIVAARLTACLAKAGQRSVL